MEIPAVPMSLIYKFNELEPRLQYLNKDNFSLLKEIYVYVDEIVSTQKGLISCSKGCSTCCKIDIQITELEANYISTMINKEYIKNKNLTINHTSNCPFLVDNLCLIYQYRPLNCRYHIVYSSAENCNNKGLERRFINSFIDKIQQYNVFKNNGWKDIRDWFEK